MRECSDPKSASLPQQSAFNANRSAARSGDIRSCSRPISALSVHQNPNDTYRGALMHNATQEGHVLLIYRLTTLAFGTFRSALFDGPLRNYIKWTIGRTRMVSSRCLTHRQSGQCDDVVT